MRKHITAIVDLTKPVNMQFTTVEPTDWQDPYYKRVIGWFDCANFGSGGLYADQPYEDVLTGISQLLMGKREDGEPVDPDENDEFVVRLSDTLGLYVGIGLAALAYEDDAPELSLTDWLQASE